MKAVTARAATGRAILISCAVIAAVRPSACPAGPIEVFETDHYKVYTDAELDDARRFADHMDRVFDEYLRRFRHFGPRDDQRMPLFLFGSREAYLDALKRHDVNGTNAAGMFVVAPTIQGLLTWIGGPSRNTTHDVLEHEGFHQFARVYLGPNLPVWANEGLAQYFEDGIFVADHVHLGLVPPHRLIELRHALREDESAIDLAALLAMDGGQWLATLNRDRRRASLLYAAAWSVTHFLIHGQRGQHRVSFESYLDLISRDTPPSEAYTRAFGGDGPNALREAWRQYVLELKPDPVAEALSRIEFLGSALREMSERGVPPPKHMNELREMLVKVKYKAYYQMHGVRYEMKATDESMYRYTLRTGGERWFELLAPARNDLPPRIVATGLKPQPTLLWSRDREGKLVQTIEFR